MSQLANAVLADVAAALKNSAGNVKDKLKDRLVEREIG